MPRAVRSIAVVAVMYLATSASADTMRSISELTEPKEPAWPDVKNWVHNAKVTAEILPVVRRDGEQTLLALQVTSRSPMGAIALESGGILVDHGWLKFLGGGCRRLKGTLATWNGRDAKAGSAPSPYLIVAYDAIGGFFAINGGGLGGPPGHVFYFAPDSLDWEDLGIGYTAFLQAALQGKLAPFYEALRWPGWEREVVAASADHGYSFHPPLWTREGKNGSSRKLVPMAELGSFGQEMKRRHDETGPRPG